ncbi:Tetratricopeptide repeat-like superfamily protein [Prunus dulcis]|uniref:Tetratricopeptide repeat-like superfamily protein n=1 Tax=Prunus dulcis TaxID=3755 RepID=A0A4Y1RJ90_PRUDU|nr:Tetratricopeptide repeat-like superfamily protein [Prunus dulcis]
MEGCAGCSVVLLDWTVHRPWGKRAPALLDNLVQAFLMAPFFVLLEVLQTAFGYEPYPGFHGSVKEKIDANLKEWCEKKQKKIS